MLKVGGVIFNFYNNYNFVTQITNQQNQEERLPTAHSDCHALPNLPISYRSATCLENFAKFYKFGYMIKETIKDLRLKSRSTKSGIVI